MLGCEITNLFNLQEKARKVVVVGGGYIGMEVAAAAVGWKLDTTVSICCIVPRKKKMFLQVL